MHRKQSSQVMLNSDLLGRDTSHHGWMRLALAACPWCRLFCFLGRSPTAGIVFWEVSADDGLQPLHWPPSDHAQRLNNRHDVPLEIATRVLHERFVFGGSGPSSV